jgi:hypothetical protein
MKLLKDGKLEILSTDFALKCKVVFKVRKNESSAIYESLKKLSSMDIQFIKTE